MIVVTRRERLAKRPSNAKLAPLDYAHIAILVGLGLWSHQRIADSYGIDRARVWRIAQQYAVVDA